jgi:transcriptional regulator with XRE-family HTH domain
MSGRCSGRAPIAFSLRFSDDGLGCHRTRTGYLSRVASPRPAGPPTAAEALGWTIKSLRVEADVSQKALAAAVPMDVSSLSRIENGRDTNPGWVTVRRLADILEVRLEDFAIRVIEFELEERTPPLRTRVGGGRSDDRLTKTRQPQDRHLAD